MVARQSDGELLLRAQARLYPFGAGLSLSLRSLRRGNQPDGTEPDQIVAQSIDIMQGVSISGADGMEARYDAGTSHRPVKDALSSTRSIQRSVGVRTV